MDDAQTKRCPDCAEEIKSEARICRFCGYDYNQPRLHVRESTEAGTSPRGLAFPLAVAAWIASSIPLSILLVEEGGTEDVIISAVAGFATGVGIAAIIRGAYALITRRPFLSPWLFVIAAVVALIAAAGFLVPEEDSGGARSPAAHALNGDRSSI